MDLGAGGKGRRKALDASINLVPFIDLMAVTISFLIMTAVWTQVGRLEVSQAGGEASPDEQPAQLPVMLVMTEETLRLSAGGGLSRVMALTRDAKGRLELDKLLASLKEVTEAWPNQKQVTLQAEDAVRYDDLVRIIDGCIGAGLPSVSVVAMTP